MECKRWKPCGECETCRPLTFAQRPWAQHWSSRNSVDSSTNESILKNTSEIKQEPVPPLKKRKTVINNTDMFRLFALSPEMTEFVGVEEDAKLTSLQVSKCIKTYIKVHNLSEGRTTGVIEPDATLRELLGGQENMTFASLPSLLKKHYM